jgi:hemoglobin
MRSPAYVRFVWARWRLPRAGIVAALGIAAVACATSGSRPPQPASAPPAAAPKASLYDRLGGKPAVSAVVDEFLRRVAGDKRINARFINTDLTQLREHLIAFASVATSGPGPYAGRDMHTAHAGMQIVDEEFGALVEDLAVALDTLKVPKPEQNELLGALGPLKAQIVAPPDAAAAKHDPALAKAAEAKADALRRAGNGQAADLLQAATTARVRGQRSYADVLFSAAEQMVGPAGLPELDPLFRDGAPERVKTALKTMPKDTVPQPPTAVGGSEEDEPDGKPKRGSLTGKVRLGGKDSEGFALVMLTPENRGYPKRKPKQRLIEQRHREFAPRFMAIPVGSTVSFPNFDPVYHNVFSLSPAKRFDLGIYKNGETREVTFTKEGIIRLGCNLHANMKCALVVVGAPHYVVTDAAGHFRFRSLTPGKYVMKTWSDKTTEPASQPIQINAGENDVTIDLPAAMAADLGTDKFGVSRAQAP